MLATYFIGTAIFLAWTLHWASCQTQVIIPKRVVLGLSLGWPIVLIILITRFGWQKAKGGIKRARNLANT